MSNSPAHHAAGSRPSERRANPLTQVSRPEAIRRLASFAKGAMGGNLAGVLLGADWISHAERQRLATMIGLSETAFVEGAPDSLKIRFYTPSKEHRHVWPCDGCGILAFARPRPCSPWGASVPVSDRYPQRNGS
jgi:hypothetical protein